MKDLRRYNQSATPWDDRMTGESTQVDGARAVSTTVSHQILEFRSVTVWGSEASRNLPAARELQRETIIERMIDREIKRLISK